MKKLFLSGLILVILLVSCQPLQEPDTPTLSPRTRKGTHDLSPTNDEISRPTEPLADFSYDPFQQFSSAKYAVWQPEDFTGPDYGLPVNLGQVLNPEVLDGATDAQIISLKNNGFFVMHTQERQFYTIREDAVKKVGQPYYLTTDAAFHALHLNFDKLLKALEKEILRPQMISLITATLDQLLDEAPVLVDTPLENDAQLSAAYLSVALKLFSPEAQMDPDLEPLVSAQVEQILAGEGIDKSVLFQDFKDDYGAYKPVGHYAGDPQLEEYFRGMTWLGRVHFVLEDSTSSRVPLIVTYAIRRAEVNGEPAVEVWSRIHEVLTFLIGPTDDGGPMEYADLMDEVYGKQINLLALADPLAWEEFVNRRDQVPAPRINSTFVDFIADLDEEAGWRFMGQRFTLDGFIFQNLVFDAVKPLGNQKRDLPTGPDIMAVLGSDAALEAVDELGATRYPNYLDQIETLKEEINEQTEQQWQNRAYDAWLYAFLPVLQPKNGSYPDYMRTPAWGYKEMNTALGSWAELKHDTILYSKMPDFFGGGGPPCSSSSPPAYVEANPQAFFRMAFIAETIGLGMLERGFAEPVDPENRIPDSDTLSGLTDWMIRLADHLTQLGEIAARELAGKGPVQDDYPVIMRCLGVAECSANTIGMVSRSDHHIEPVPVVAAVAGGQSGILEAAVGKIDRIFVVVPIDGQLHIAQGGVFSYYEFTQPRNSRLTDQEWRDRLSSDQGPALPAWSNNFISPDGETADRIGFHIGAAYAITEEGDKLNLRANPDLTAEILSVLGTNEFVEVIDGPILTDGYTWWKLQICGEEATGWSVEDPTWYDYIY